MKNTLQLFISTLLVASCLILSSCENLLVKTLELEEFEYEKQLAISGSLFSSEDNFNLLISENQAITDPFEEWMPATEAVSTLYKNGEEIGQLAYAENPLNGPDNIFQLNVESLDIGPGDYTLEVDHPTLGMATASTSIPESVEITNIEFEEDFGIAPSTFESSDALLVSFVDPPGDNYYSIKIDNNTLILDTVVISGDTIIYESGIYLGLDTDEFGALVIPDGIYFNDDLFDGEDHTVTLFLTGFEWEEDKEAILNNMVLNWEVLSEDKFNFDTSLETYYNSQGFGPFTEAVSVYNNIEGGVGVFAGVNRTYVPVR